MQIDEPSTANDKINQIDSSTVLQINAGKKPWLTVEEQIQRLEAQGVKFELYPRDKAKVYLEKNNNYFRLKSYRKTFQKYDAGENEGKYISLDFAMLVDLSVIDFRLRQQMLPMTLDIEHFEKMRLLKRIEDEGKDGYRIVADYINSNDIKQDGKITNRVKNDINRGKTSPYIADLISSYENFCYPAWAFMEVIAFGTFLDFYKFCAEQFDGTSMRNNFYLLKSIKSMRNACAYNNCILNDLTAGKARHSSYILTRAMGPIKGISKQTRRSRLSNDRLQEIATTLYKHQEVASEGVYNHRLKELSIFANRLHKNAKYYKSNPQVIASFEFIAKLIGAWYSSPYV